MEQADVNILVVDDVNAIRVQLKELLRSFGFRKIHLASSGPEAKAALEADQFQMILCDWHMEPMSGLALLKYVRTHAKHKQIAFIMVTAESTRDLVLEAIHSGVDDYIVKPLTLGHMNKIYGALLKRQVI